MSYQQAKDLLTKYRSGECTDAEKLLVEEWLFQYNNGPIDLSEEKILEIQQEIWMQLPQPARRRTLWPRLAAAAILLLLSAGGYFIFHTTEKQAPIAKTIEIIPGTNKAILTLANGKTIVLNNAQKGNIAVQGNISIQKTGEGDVTYKGTTDSIQYNTLTTPRGGQFHITLADGTEVWLNAASSIRYPTAFKGTERQVELTGEAYFEVARNSHQPFYVKSSAQTVQVLGTHFNVHTYNNESAIRTTLLEGSIKVSSASGKSVLLKPGQQSTIINNNISVKEDADTEEAIAWKDGKFKFDDTDLRTVMLQLERWYDIEVKYEGTMNNLRFSGGTFMNKNLSEVLKVLALSGVHYRIEGRTVIIY
jgi:ferric-dicitrate binding protein FerR (iron transport regulator)